MCVKIGTSRVQPFVRSTSSYISLSDLHMYICRQTPFLCSRNGVELVCFPWFMFSAATMFDGPATVAKYLAASENDPLNVLQFV